MDIWLSMWEITAESEKKSIYAVWELEEIHGEKNGKIDCYITGELNEDETKNLRFAVKGRDGFGESFEQRAIQTIRYGNSLPCIARKKAYAFKYGSYAVKMLFSDVKYLVDFIKLC